MYGTKYNVPLNAIINKINGIVTIHYFHAERYATSRTSQNELPRIPINITLPPDNKQHTWNDETHLQVNRVSKTFLDRPEFPNDAPASAGAVNPDYLHPPFNYTSISIPLAENLTLPTFQHAIMYGTKFDVPLNAIIIKMNSIVTIHYFYAKRYATSGTSQNELPRIPINITLPPDNKQHTWNDDTHATKYIEEETSTLTKNDKNTKAGCVTAPICDDDKEVCNEIHATICTDEET
eukprot:CAMPEP_0172518500 /NCGR_PEP_ID=MMETSP1066-20121228/290861_1 /TAXON_ID=671091 /ORGANISM="Coscinodiscus wailesii, Strain CCMP2513" /LENGTH=235 /DNA_ID=CAMNT_0013300911 /DNA_START=185 /DNA_END=890 /DNA_ORIENTATION=-